MNFCNNHPTQRHGLALSTYSQSAPLSTYPHPLMLTALNRTQMHRTFAAMEQHGGGFCRALAQAWYVADISNKARIEAAFPHLVEDFGPGSAYYSDDA